MSDTIWVEVRGRPVADTSNDCSILHRLMDDIDRLAGRLGVAKLSAFYDYSELEDAYAKFAPDPDAADDSEAGDDEPGGEPSLAERQAKGVWFDAAVGLAAVCALRQHLARDFASLTFNAVRSTEHWPGYPMDELAHVESVLAEAASHGRQFRLLVVP